MGLDQEIQRLYRELTLDPENAQAKSRYISALLRLPRDNVPRILEDLDRWQSAAPPLQDLAIHSVANTVAEDLEWLDTRDYQCAGVTHRLGRFLHKKTQYPMMLIPGGRFEMGSNDGFADESPIHSIHIDAMFVGQRPLTQAQWQSIGPVPDEIEYRDDFPIYGVSWDVVTDALNSANLRLPSEAEWEYACRANSKEAYFWGQDFEEAYCWHRDNAGRAMSVEDHKTQCNAFGLSDTLGLVWEWCEDGYSGLYKPDKRDLVPGSHKKDDDGRELRAMRGGSWRSPAINCRSAMRNWSTIALHPMQNTLDASSLPVIGVRAFRSLNP